MVVENRLTEKEKEFLLEIGYWGEHDAQSFPECDWYKLSESRYIPFICAQDWFRFRTIKTGNLIKDFEWWLNKAIANYGIFPSDLELIKAENYTYKSAEDFPDTLVRDFIRWMKTA